MKNYLKTIFLGGFMVLIAGLFSSSKLQIRASGNIKAGISKIIITPEKPVRMSGYDARKDPFKGVHDDLQAGAVVFDNGENKACIITAEVIAFAHDYVDETKERITRETGIPEQHILMTAVHNHGGPVTRAYGDDLTANEKEYIKTLQDKIVQVVKEAADNVQPLRIGAGKGECKMNINRRAKQANGSVWLGRNPDGVCDHEVGVIRIDDMSGKTIGVFVNWPCHATTGGQDNYQITADWPGAAARDIADEYGDPLVLITAGASGDINPIYGPNDNFNDINAIGKDLADEVVRVCKEIDTYELKDMEVVTETLNANGKKRSESRMPNVSLDPGPDVDIRITSLKIGNILFCGISGELMNEIGLQVKKDSPFKYTYILTHCNGSSGYLVTDKAYKEGGYEPMVSRTMPGTEEMIIQGFRMMNNEM